MKKNIFLFSFIIFLIIGLYPFKTEGVFSNNSDSKIIIHFFYSTLCPLCQKEKIFLEELKEKYPAIEIKEYELTYQPQHKKILEKFYQDYRIPRQEQGLVPITFIRNDYFIGFSPQIAGDIENCIQECLLAEKKIRPEKINLPIFGPIDISKTSLLVLTVVLGALDGFNPCAMWVLLFLIALLINTRSTKKMLIVGGTFVAVSGLVYYLILAAWLNLFFVISYVHLTRIIIGSVALTLGIWQIKNFITYHPGACKVLGLKSTGLRAKVKNKLLITAKKVVVSPITLATILGVIILALGVNLIEFFCSAGLPALYTRILALNQLNLLSYYLYLLFYTVIFIFDDILILLAAIFTFKKIGLTEKYNYWATLFGGLLIFILGLLLIFKPGWLMFS